MRGQRDSKSDTCTEHAEVNAAGISVKVGAPYLGRSDSTWSMERQPVSRGTAELSEVSRGHSRSARQDEGPNTEQGENLSRDDEGDADQYG